MNRTDRVIVTLAILVSILFIAIMNMPIDSVTRTSTGN